MSKLKVLLVQDARTQGNSTKRFLEHAGHQVIWAGSGMSALLAAGKHSVDLILIDLSLPDIDGSDLCQRFRARRDSHTIPIILFTTQETSAGAFRRKGDGPDAFLTKPFTEAQLAASIEAVLAARAAAAAEVDRKRQEEERRTQAQAKEQPEERIPRPAARTEPAGMTVPGPRSALKPKPAPDRPPPGDASPQPAPKPVLRLVPKPPPAASAQSEAKPATEPRAATLQQKPQEMAPPAPSEPPFTGTAQEVIDPATGLFSRPQFNAMFSKEFKRAVRFKQQMSCMLIDLDGSAMGRTANEALVKALIGVVQRTIREVDTAAWWTGGALIVLLPNTMRNDAVQAGMRILEAMAEHPFTWPDATKVTVSIGVAGLPDRRIDSEQKMIDAAASACTRARETMRRR